MTDPDLLADHADTTREGAAGGEARELVRQLSHALRQPLSTIESIGFLLGARTADSAKMRRQLNLALEQVNSVIDNAVYYVGAVPARPVLFDLKELLAHVLVERYAEAHPHLTIDWDPGVVWAEGDRGQIAHMLRCLIQGFQALARHAAQARMNLEIRPAAAVIRLVAPEVRLTADEIEREMEPLGCLACAERIAFANKSRLEVCSGPESGFSVALHIPLRRLFR